MSVSNNQWMQQLPWIDRPGADIAKFLAAREPAKYFDANEKLSFWQKNGFAIFENAVSSKFLDSFEADLDNLIKNSHDFNVSIEILGQQTYTKAVTPEKLTYQGVKFNHLHTISRAAAFLSLTPAISEFLNFIFEEPPVVTQSLYFVKGSQQPIHVDYPFVNRQKRLSYLAASWIPLEDILSTAGPLEYYPGAHQIAISGFFDWGGGDIIKGAQSTNNSMQFAQFLKDRVEAAKIEPVTFCPKRGDVLLWHGNMPHAGTKITDPNSTRRSYVTHYTGLSDYPESWRLPVDQWQDRSTQINGGFAFQFPWTDYSNMLPSWEKMRGK